MVNPTAGLLTSDQTRPGHAIRRADEYKLVGSKLLVNFGESNSAQPGFTAVLLLFFFFFFLDQTLLVLYLGPSQHKHHTVLMNGQFDRSAAPQPDQIYMGG